MKTRIAIVGLGFGAEFIPIYQKHPDAELVAICQRNEKSLNEVGDQFGIEKRFTSYEELLKDPDIDAVHINTPIPNHGAQSIQALKAGKHVAYGDFARRMPRDRSPMRREKLKVYDDGNGGLCS